MNRTDALSTYARLGWALFPLTAGSKHPLAGSHGVLDATKDPMQIALMWAQHPDANIGLACGEKSGVIALDVDVKNGAGGDATLTALIDQHGPLPQTLEQTTPTGGTHYLFEYAPGVKNSVSAIGKGLDIRSDGGYIVLAPSAIEGAGEYAWRNMLLLELGSLVIAPMPEWLLERIKTAGTTNSNGKKPARPTEEWRKVIGGVPKGNRQDELPRVVGKFYQTARGDFALARQMARQYGQGCDPALTQEEVDACCDRIEEKEAAKGTTTNDDPGGERYTDMQNGARIAAEAEGKAVHVEETKDRWHLFDGMKLVEESKTAMVPFVRTIARRLFEEAKALKNEALECYGKLGAVQPDDPAMIPADELMDLAILRESGAKRLESRDGCYSGIDMAKASMRVKMAALDAHPLWLNTPSATIDLETGETWKPRVEDYLTKVTRATYDPTAQCPRWLAFLEQVLPSAEVRAFMQRTIGYCLTDLTNEQCLWFLYGTGRNGKTTFLNAVRHMLGDYAASTKASTLMVKSHGDDRRNDIAVLRGARFVSITEAEDGHQIAESLIKEITGQDPVTARRLYADFFTFTPTFKILLAANHKPTVRGQDLAIWRRIRLVPFEQTIPLEQVDRGLPAALEQEASGILNWAIEGFKDWQRGGLRPPSEVEAATETYRLESDTLREFFEDKLVLGPSREATAGETFRAYQRWAESNGIQRPLTQQGLGRALSARSYQQKKYGKDGQRLWVGFGLRVQGGGR